MMGDKDYIPVKIVDNKIEILKNELLKRAIEDALKTKERADILYGKDEDYYKKYYPDREIPKDETEELISRYKEINNVLYPKDIKEIENLVKSAENEFKEIEKERWLNHGKDVIGASLSIGSAFIPAAAGVRITALLARTLAPKLGTKLAFEVSKNAVIGAISGSVMGLGDSLINNENPITTMLRYALIDSLLGMGFGAIGYKAAPIITSALKKNNNVKLAVDFLKKGKVSNELENITVKIEDIAKYMPELKPFTEEIRGTIIRFKKGMGTSGGTYNSETDTITYNIENMGDSLYHEMQHAIDIKYIKSHPENKDLQIILKSGERVNTLMRNYEQKYADVFEKLMKFNNQPVQTEETFNMQFSIEEKNIIIIWYNKYKVPYENHMLEFRAREANLKGIKHARTIQETTAELRNKSEIWKIYEGLGR